jgi:hypothetical protein
MVDRSTVDHAVALHTAGRGADRHTVATRGTVLRRQADLTQPRIAPVVVAVSMAAAQQVHTEVLARKGAPVDTAAEAMEGIAKTGFFGFENAAYGRRFFVGGFTQKVRCKLPHPILD